MFILPFHLKNLQFMIWEKRWFQFAILLVLAFKWGDSLMLMKVGLKKFQLRTIGCFTHPFCFAGVTAYLVNADTKGREEPAYCWFYR
jgi:hypothetical protein